MKMEDINEENAMERTLLLIKPDGMQFREAIIRRVQEAGFITLQTRTIRLTPEQASEFYKNKSEDPNFAAMVISLTEGPIHAMCMTKKNAVADLNLMVGPENGAMTTSPNSLRAIFANNCDLLKNAVHASDTTSDAQYEIHFFFPNIILEPIHAIEDINCYLQGSVNMTLMDGLFELAKERPNEPVEWLATYLMDHNPFKPIVTDPDEYSVQKMRELERAASRDSKTSSSTTATASTSEKN